mgnify:CR=1 FL=1
MLLIKELIITFFISIGVLVSCHFLRVPIIVGLLISGVLVGPDIIGLIQSRNEIALLAEIGIVLLLFTIGAEFSLSGFLKLKRVVIIGGLTQMVLTLAVISGLALGANFPWQDALIIGIAFSMSSTALVLKQLQDRGELDSLHGRSTFAILVFQDLALVPLMLFIPLLSENILHTGSAVGATLKSFILLTTVIAGSYWIVPRILKAISHTRIPELFLITIVTICFSVAFVSEMAGLSLALGALLAGFIISESDYAHQAIAHIHPFKQLFTTVFFISIGMLLDLDFLREYWLSIIMTTVVVVLIKFACAMTSALAGGLPVRASIQTGLCLAQVGEFSFVIAAFASKLGLIEISSYQFILSVSILSMTLTPMLVNSAVQSSETLKRWPLFKYLYQSRARLNEKTLTSNQDSIINHVILIGYGSMGKLIAEALEATRVPYVAIELNPDIIEFEQTHGKLIVYGDGGNEHILEKENLESAKAVIITLHDMIAVRRIILAVRSLSAQVKIIVRAKFPHEISELKALGATDVIAEEVQAAVEIYSRTLSSYMVSKPNIDSLIKETIERANSSGITPTTTT